MRLIVDNKKCDDIEILEEDNFFMSLSQKYRLVFVLEPFRICVL